MILRKAALHFLPVLGLLACAHAVKAPVEPPNDAPSAANSAPSPAVAQPVSGEHGSTLPACAPRTARVGMCILKLNPDDNFSNDDPARAGSILAIGEARPECFAATNWPHAIPITMDNARAPTAPEGTLWLRIQDPANGQLLVGIAAPGIEQLGIRVGDKAAIHWPISVGGEWGWGTSELRVEGRGRVQIALNDLETHGLAFGPGACRREVWCGGTDHALERKAGGQALLVGPLQSVRSQEQLVTNGETLEHGPDFRETEEGYTGPPGCQGQKRASLVSIVTKP